MTEERNVLLRKLFNFHLKKYGGIPPNLNQLHAAASIAYKKLNQPEFKLSKKDVSNFLNNIDELAQFSQTKNRPKYFQSIGVLKPGVFFIDYAEFRKDLSEYNSSYTGFLLAVMNVTNKMYVYPCKNKGTLSWSNAVKRFVELNQDVSVICSDQDSVAKSEKFRKDILLKYGIRWYFLKKGMKAYLAERYIGIVKTFLSKALQYDKKQSNNWIQFVKPLVRAYNTEKIPYFNKISFLNFSDLATLS